MKKSILCLPNLDYFKHLNLTLSSLSLSLSLIFAELFSLMSKDLKRSVVDCDNGQWRNNLQ